MKPKSGTDLDEFMAIEACLRSSCDLKDDLSTFFLSIH
jgi:hypothetical protein